MQIKTIYWSHGELEDGNGAGGINLPSEFDRAGPLLDSEVQMLPERRRQQNESTFTFPAQFSLFKNRETIVSVHSSLLQKTPPKFDSDCLASLCPETTKECMALIPSLKGHLEDEELQWIAGKINLFSFQYACFF
uniref:RNA polymerase Rpb4/RPC9 core domain-containing protein n=1 Tax=Oryctolagus cuniculus TaxID=9986 RepID=A0A5F9DG51_RABIT